MDGRVIVVAYDASPEAAHALRVAAQMLGPRRVVIATVWEEGMAVATAVPSTEFGMSPAPLDVETALEVDHAVEAHAARVAAQGAELARSLGLDAEPVAIADEVNVAETLVHLANERGAEALVLGSRGLHGLRARLSGSTSHAVLRHAHLPVLIVPRDDEKKG
jgi:nucleotide-binding universal stress UspA family protein